ncbi:hypothetical protein ACIBL3_11905 [Kribbella sp. NPDC050124]|uniref:hypothetical protein n=1 Tax=Kribbella sp. NPDC050124 TaxID=3364114 RepID=UPI00379FBA14
MGTGTSRARGMRHALSRFGAGLASLAYAVVAVFVLGFAIIDLPDSLRAARNEGVPGTFTTTRKECRPWWEKGGGCTYFGNFTSGDGRVQSTNVLFEGDPGEVGEKVPAQYVGTPDRPSIHGADSDEWVFVAALGLGATGYLGWRGWRGWRFVRARLRPVTSARAE